MFFLQHRCWIKLLNFIEYRRINHVIYPTRKDIFRSFSLTPFHMIKVVILGQDPYHQFNQANGLAFSVRKGIKIPPSLNNIYKELKYDIPNINITTHGCLDNWAKQGVFLLNTILTVEHGKPKSHVNIGWKNFTSRVISYINYHHIGIIFLLWGKESINFRNIIDSKKHHILTASHPSPFSAHRGFFGCRHFSKSNKILIQSNKDPIDWSIN
ncbi:uracil-DNA glycosylase [Buchnera aphidicola]|uniref:uracil-DNA glycosylase n=1 Tax=Buchnera aphidicola TaxID=9 RepID=UPI003463F4D9